MASTSAAYPNSDFSPSRIFPAIHVAFTSAVVRDVFAGIVMAVILLTLCMVPA